MLIDHLPPESATQTAIRNSVTPEVATLIADQADPAEAPWSVADMLAATIVDELRLLRHTMIQLKSETSIGPPPEPMPRPGVKRKKSRRKMLSAKQRADLDPRLAAVPDMEE